MSILTNVVKLLTSDIQTTLITLLIGFVVYKLTKFYAKVLSLPPGPFPLPLLGNILFFRGTKEHWTVELRRVADKHGSVFTMWMGTLPLVVITDIDIAREAYKKNDFAGRTEGLFKKMFSNETSSDIIFTDYGHHWEALRRIGISAVQKYSKTDKLCYLVSDCVDHTINKIIEKEGINTTFDPSDYFHNTILNILAASAFGARYELDDPEYIKLKYYIQDMVLKELNQRFVFWEMFPILQKIDKKFNEMNKEFRDFYELLKTKFQSHYKEYDDSIVRDFCDTLISAKNDAIKEDKESTPYLSDENLSWVILDLFLAGVNTSHATFKWIVFLMTYYPEVLKKLRKEIESEIGDRIPTHEDRDRCHYVMAVISETLRLRNVVPNGVNHKAVVTSKIGGYTIPKGTQIMVLQGSILRKEEYWHNSKEFSPERFLENGKYITSRPKAFIPFSYGRRVCLGEKLAIADLFLLLVRFIQKTSDYDLTLDYSGDTEGDPNNFIELSTKDYKIIFKK